MAHQFYEEIHALAETPCLFDPVTPPWENLQELRRAAGVSFVTIDKTKAIKSHTPYVEKAAAALLAKARSGAKASVFVKDPEGYFLTKVKPKIKEPGMHPRRFALFVKRNLVFPLHAPSKISDTDKAMLQKIDRGKLDITKVNGGYRMTIKGMKMSEDKKWAAHADAPWVGKKGKKKKKKSAHQSSH